MNRPSRFLRLCATALIAVLLGSGMPIAFAGTTGALSGVVTDESQAPVSGARVTVTSPSQTANATTDSSGHYAFVSLAPDEYTITVAHTGFDNASLSGIAIFADASQIVPISMRKSLKTIATVTSRSSGELVRSGTTADVYSVNAAQQARTNVLGGGGNLNSAYSAISAVPGAYVPSGQSGYNQAVHVRGGDSSEVGYEFDGIPVNRAFDNYPSGSASSLGQVELQVYTGAAPADAEAQGLAGFINQVIKTGTAPGYGAFDLTAGTPTFYHSLNFEAGGATPDRRFSYYVGIGGFNQDHRYIDQQDGASYASEFGPPLDICPAPPLPANAPASCFTNGTPNISAQGTPGYILGPMPFGNLAAGVQDRTSVLNFHFAIPHKNDGLRDDVQILYDNDSIQTPLYVSPLDEGLNNLAFGTNYGGALPYYTDSYQYGGKTGTFLSDANASLVTPYYFPSSPENRALFATLPLTGRDIQYNNQAIVKLQYQHALSSDSFLRLYGYTYYSNYNAAGPYSSWQYYVGYDSGDYELNSHTRGLSASFVKQFSSKHLVQAEASYVTATSLRMNATQVYGAADSFAVLVNGNDLASGTCYAIYDASGNPTAPTPTTCGTGNKVPTALSPTFASLANTYANGVVTSVNPGDVSQASLSGLTCGTGPCQMYTVENGAAGKYNTVTPVFTGFSLTDEWRPSEKLLFNLGLRLDSYKYEGDNTTGTAARAFWFNAFNNDTCYNTQNLTLVDKSTLETGTFNAGTPCSSFGSQYTAASMQNVPNQTFTYVNVQPRLGVTYTLNPDTVLRASYGKYVEQPSAAYEQYDALQQNLPDQLVGFYSLGFNTPGHAVRPAVSYNADFSYERHFKGTDMSVKITPFYRQTHDQIENFYLNIQQGFISGLNAGQQTSRGFEFAFTKGSFDRDGFAAQLGFAYTYADLKFNTLPNGTTVLSPINADISNYNAYTKSCQPGGSLYGKTAFGTPLCGSLPAGETAAPCYAAGVADPTCAAGSVANPYWNAPGQGLLDPNASYLPYSTIPGGIGTGVNAYTYPYVASLILQWKEKKLAVTPSFQYVAGNRYGAPETTPGIDPATCSALAGSVTGDARYPYGAPGGAPYDAATCGSGPVIPDPYTGQFDALGAFRQPAQLLAHLRLSYDFNSHLSANVTFANILSTCFGGQQTAFTYYQNKNACSYGPVMGGIINPIGNAYNPGDNVQTALRYPYQPVFGTYNDLTSSIISPFSMYFNVKIRL